MAGRRLWVCWPSEQRRMRGIEFLVNPLDRFPLPEAAGDSEDPPNNLVAAPRSSVVEPYPVAASEAVAQAQSSVGAARGRDEASDGIEVDSKRPRLSYPASQSSAMEAVKEAEVERPVLAEEEEGKQGKKGRR